MTGMTWTKSDPPCMACSCYLQKYQHIKYGSMRLDYDKYISYNKVL